MSKKKVLIISGPTSTGKTSLAVKLAQRFNGELISADSRQIYRGLDIGTGKDHPSGTLIHLVDILNPNQTFSAFQFRRLALEKIKTIHQKKKLPIIVGGTGYYIDSLVKKEPQFLSPPRPWFRSFFNLLPSSFLKLLHLLFNRRQYLNLNQSEKNNPQRLIRKLEVKLPGKKNKIPPFPYDFLHLNLTAPQKILNSRIDQRVKSRLKQGLLKEIEKLLVSYDWSDPGLKTLAYQEFEPYFASPSPQTLISAVAKWRQHEHAYAKRQLTWFKKRPALKFFYINSSAYPSSVISFVAKWYNKL
ncbi:tRNA (adenosine(37)-N6)-dimethylallyltransferase MiaA [Patescibacteria group bacterium]|nr:tRNA (adenosine(37)-N6)-dimethylallyltransferase MiaA [Patescibacteria group bacterium]